MVDATRIEGEGGRVVLKCIQRYCRALRQLAFTPSYLSVINDAGFELEAVVTVLDVWLVEEVSDNRRL